MTRDEAKDIVFNYALGQKITDSINTLDEIIDQIFDEHYLEIKAKDEEIYKYQMAIDKQSKRAEALKQLSLDKDEEIDRLKEFEEMVEWMELNSNRSLCDYYNNKDNA